MRSNNIKAIGKPAALLAAIFAIIYSVFALLSLFKLIPHPYDLFWQFLPSLLLAFAFVVTIICVHYCVGEEHKIYTGIASALAVIYAACVTIVYFTQLAVIIPLQLQHKIDDSHLLAFSNGSFMVAVDCIGYGIMSLTTLFAAFAFKTDGSSKWLYRSLLYNGLLAPFVVMAFFIPAFLAIGALWMITLPTAMINIVRFFGRPTYQAFLHPTHEPAGFKAIHLE
jgi:hypothetical protein